MSEGCPEGSTIQPTVNSPTSAPTMSVKIEPSLLTELQTILTMADHTSCPIPILPAETGEKPGPPGKRKRPRGRPRKRGSRRYVGLSQSDRKAAIREESRVRTAQRRAEMSYEERELEKEKNREQISLRRRFGMTDEQKAEVKEKNRVRAALKRAMRSEEEKERVKEQNRLRVEIKRKYIMTEEQTAIVREKNRRQAAIRRAIMTEEEKAEINEKNKLRAAVMRSCMSGEQKAAINEKNKERARLKRQSMSKEERADEHRAYVQRMALIKACDTEEERTELKKRFILESAERRKHKRVCSDVVDALRAVFATDEAGASNDIVQSALHTARMIDQEMTAGYDDTELVEFTEADLCFSQELAPSEYVTEVDYKWVEACHKALMTPEEREVVFEEDRVRVAEQRLLIKEKTVEEIAEILTLITEQNRKDITNEDEMKRMIEMEDMFPEQMDVLKEWCKGCIAGVGLGQALEEERKDINALIASDEQTTDTGDTALHIAARLSHKECVTTLVNSGASVRLPNKTGKLCIDDAPPDIIALISKLEKERDSRNFVSNTRQPRNTVLHSDISCGKEKIPLPCINEVDDVPAPLDFVYVKESFESSYLCINRNMNTIKSCVCENQCRPGNPCSCFFLTTGNKCIYNKDGKLNTEISEQFSDLVIFECNQRCRCWAHCRNRVIQKGLSNPIQLFRTNGKGWGVRSSKVLSKGTFICEYIGEIISDSDADRRLNDTYLFDLTVVSINSSKKENKTIGSIDACHYGNISRFINSSCEPNCVPVKVFVDHQDLRFPRIAFFTTKDVEPYEELTFYYGDSFWDVKKEVLKCCCGAPNCISLMSREDIESDNSSDVEIVE